jgi:hypothetical protein
MCQLDFNVQSPTAGSTQPIFVHAGASSSPWAATSPSAVEQGSPPPCSAPGCI